MIRAAAKNHAFTTVATSPEQYSSILEGVAAQGCTTLELRERLAREAFACTARYDQAIAAYFAGQVAEGPFPATLSMAMTRKAVLRYGENPHQQAAVYAKPRAKTASVVAAKKLHGKGLSYNNLLDLDSALAIVRSSAEPAASVIKHNNPCGAASAPTLAEALRNALTGDPPPESFDSRGGDGSGPVHLGGQDNSGLQIWSQATDDGFDFGQFGHGTSFPGQCFFHKKQPLLHGESGC